MDIRMLVLFVGSAVVLHAIIGEATLSMLMGGLSGDGSRSDGSYNGDGYYGGSATTKAPTIGSMIGTTIDEIQTLKGMMMSPVMAMAANIMSTMAGMPSYGTTSPSHAPAQSYRASSSHAPAQSYRASPSHASAPSYGASPSHAPAPFYGAFPHSSSYAPAPSHAVAPLSSPTYMYGNGYSGYYRNSPSYYSRSSNSASSDYGDGNSGSGSSYGSTSKRYSSLGYSSKKENQMNADIGSDKESFFSGSYDNDSTTGSIKRISLKPSLEGVYERKGVTSKRYSAGDSDILQYAGLLSRIFHEKDMKLE